MRPWDEPKDKRLFTSLFATAWGCDCDEVRIVFKQYAHNPQSKVRMVQTTCSQIFQSRCCLDFSSEMPPLPEMSGFYRSSKLVQVYQQVLICILQKIGITAVLNTAEGPWSEWGFVDLSPSHYQGSGIHYQVPLLLLLLSVDFLEDILTRVSACGTHREPPSSHTLDQRQITWTLCCQRQEERFAE